mgnify:CR=1 FL=1
MTDLDDTDVLGAYQKLVERRYGAGETYSVALVIMWAERHISDRIEAVLRKFKLNMPQWSTLTILHLSSADSISLGKIARALDVHGTTVTNAVDQLVARGLIKRTPDPNDRRTVCASITAAGKKRADEVMQALADERFGLPEVASKDLRALVGVIQRIFPMRLP